MWNRNVNRHVKDSTSSLDLFALWITEHVGTMAFFTAVVVWTSAWLLWNFLAPEKYQFDPPMAFTFWLFISNCIQILLMPLILVGQNIQSRHQEACAERDLAVDIHSERILCQVNTAVDSLRKEIITVSDVVDTIERKIAYITEVIDSLEIIDAQGLPTASQPSNKSHRD